MVFSQFPSVHSLNLIGYNFRHIIAGKNEIGKYEFKVQNSVLNYEGK